MLHKRNHIEAAMVSHGIVLFLIICLVGFGIWSLPHMNKDEFPPFTIRQGVVAAVYPGATAQEVETQVTGKLEQFLFTYPEISKNNTYSVSEDGMAYIYVELLASVTNKDQVWAKIRAGLDLFHKTSLPKGVLQLVVVDDFGSTSSMLLAIESDERTPRELAGFANELCERLRTIPTMGKVKVTGEQHEQISVDIDPDRLASYPIDQNTVMTMLATQGFRTIGGKMGNASGGALLHVASSVSSEYELGDQIIYSNASDGTVIHLRDIATITRCYPEAQQFVNYYESGDSVGHSAVIVDIQMIDDKNIVAFGEQVEQILTEARQQMPADLRFYRITDQPKVVDDSVLSFLGDIALSILVVIAVMLLLFPLRTALVAGSGVPICIFITLGIMYLCHIQLHTVTLGALIVVLGMLVDNSIIVIDGYTNTLARRHSRWYSAAVSTQSLFMPMLVATCSISAMFFPMLKIITGPLNEFIQLFPVTILIALTTSIAYAVWYTPHLCTVFIRPSTPENMNGFERIQTRFFERLQQVYETILSGCFRHPWLTLATGVGSLLLGMFLFTQLNIQLMPKAERSCFAVEIHLNEGATIHETAIVADSLARRMQQDERVTGVTSFVGMSSPRFHCTYAPQIGKPSYAQFIVNTTSSQATTELLEEYQTHYEHLFTNAYIRYKQMDYQAVKAPVEIYFKGQDLDASAVYMEQLKQYMSQQPELMGVHSDYDESVCGVSIQLISEEAERLGITETMLSLYLNTAMGGQTVTTLWEENYGVPMVLYRSGHDTLDYRSLGDMLVPTIYPGVSVPLRQVASIEPEWHHASIGHRNNVRTITLSCDLRGNTSQPTIQKRLNAWLKEHPAPEGVTIGIGGLTQANNTSLPEIIWSFIAAIIVMFAVLLYHFKKLSVAVLTIMSSLLVVFGSFLGLYIFQLDITITAILGMVALIGVIVRNAIMMYEYAEELHFGSRHLTVHDAAFEAGLRRMRPIFLTSATTALGVIPMITAHTSLWMPMGVVICFGTIFTLPLVVTVLPIAYWKVYNQRQKQAVCCGKSTES